MVCLVVFQKLLRVGNSYFGHLLLHKQHKCINFYFVNVTAPSSQPTTPKTPNFPSGPNFPDPDAHLDPMERAIRARQKEAEERKRRVLAAYDIVAKQGTGPKTVVLEEFRDLNGTTHCVTQT